MTTETTTTSGNAGGEREEEHMTIEERSWRQVAGQNNTTIKQFAEDWVDGDGEE